MASPVKRRLNSILINRGAEYYFFASPRWAVRPIRSVPLHYGMFEQRGRYVGLSRNRDFLIGETWTNVILSNVMSNGYPAGYMRNYQSAYNRAHAKFINRLRMGADADTGETSDEESQLGVALAEVGQTADFVRERTDLILSYTRSIYENREKESRELAEQLRTRKGRKLAKYRKFYDTSLARKWGVPRWLSARWLEYWLCVAPTIGDMHAAAQVLTKAHFFQAEIAGSSGYPLVRYYRDSSPYPPVIAYRNDDGRGMGYVKVGGFATLSNPNHALAVDLGIANPLVIAAELVPFSFVAGWFVNWNQYLSSFTDTAGFALSNTYYTSYAVMEGTQHAWAKHEGPFPTVMQLRAVGMKRTVTSIPAPFLKVTLPNRLSLSRAATAMSLVVSLLTSK